ncbi:MAG: DUF839 domain-containing protein [Deltaproteobacteria bacterium]|nr:MAG: DUF839 domain-containing protein [Deltaproteobacteria bacterium]
MPLTRRAVLVGGLGLGGLTVLLGVQGRRETALIADPNGILDLPEGFSYRVLQRVGDRMSDGFRVPGRPDGMACFARADGSLVLMRNHELRKAKDQAAYRMSDAPAEAYDRDAPGGVTRLVLGPDGEVRSSNLVLTGTMGNCAGGPSPWGWMSCEEHPEGEHGYVFLCDPEAATVQPPKRIDGYGRMNHEAFAIDPVSRVAWLTEDRGDGCLYRFVPEDPAEPFVGKLQAMAVDGVPDTTPLADTAATWKVRWIDVPDAPDDGLRAASRSAGASTVCRGEGCWFHDGKLVFCATSGGPHGKGQVWLLDPATDTLSLVAVGDGESLSKPDNVTVSPAGHVVIAEDNSAEDHIRAVRADGTVVALARNAVSSSEFCGVCFSPDGQQLFVNLQEDGLTLAIRGPFEALLG